MELELCILVLIAVVYLTCTQIIIVFFKADIMLIKKTPFISGTKKSVTIQKVVLFCK